jgi:hypothetical protein
VAPGHALAEKGFTPPRLRQQRKVALEQRRQFPRRIRRAALLSGSQCADRTGGRRGEQDFPDHHSLDDRRRGDSFPVRRRAPRDQQGKTGGGRHAHEVIKLGKAHQARAGRLVRRRVAFGSLRRVERRHGHPPAPFARRNCLGPSAAEERNAPHRRLDLGLSRLRNRRTREGCFNLTGERADLLYGRAQDGILPESGLHRRPFVTAQLTQRIGGETRVAGK